LLLPGTNRAEKSAAGTAGKSLRENPPTVNRIRISGNKAATTEEIRDIMLTSTQTSFLGTGLFGGASHTFNPEDFDKDIVLIKKLYTFKGYFFTTVDTTIVRKSGGRKVDLSISIDEHEPSRIDSISYSGVEKVPEEIRAQYLKESKLKQKDIFSVEKLIQERDRSIDFFREYGYAFFQPDSIRIKVDTLGLKAGVHFRLKLPDRVSYGPVKVVVHAPGQRDKEESARRFTRDSISVTIYGRQKFSDKLFPYSVAWRPGQTTKHSLEQRTLQNFGATNLFSSISITNDSVRSGNLYTTVNLEPSPKHQIEPKVLVDNRYGSLFIGGAMAYENKNLFGKAEQFRLSGVYGTQTTSNTNLLGSLKPGEYAKVIPHELSLKANLVMPVLQKQGSFYTTALEYSQSTLPVLLTSRTALVRGSYSTQSTKNSRINFDFFEIQLVRKDSLQGFKQLFKTDLAKNIRINPNDPAAVNRGIDSLLQTRIDQTFRLQYNYSNRNELSPLKTTTWNLSTTAEASGSLLWFIDKYIDTKSYSNFTDTDPQIFGTTYSQYVKLDTQLSFAKDITPDRQFAGRVAIGWMSPYGKATTTPEEHRFYAGGSNSMRGWLFNRLGPGSSSNAVVSNFGADIKAELGLEYRMKLFKFFGQPSGVTFFTDAGNIWDRTGPYAFSLHSLTNDFAWDWGTGLRIGSPIGPFRFDFAWKIRDPANPTPWQISHMNLSNFTFNFGIGEAF
jgi:outer membrane protein assembly factor BamA